MLRWLLVLLIASVCCFSCFSGRKKGGGTNIGTGSGSDFDPGGGVERPALRL